jgi:hypothetical protein
MSGIFSKPKTQSYTPAPEPSASVEEATFQPGGEDEKDNDVKKRKMGKKRLQIPTGTTTTTTSGSGVGGI